VPCVTN